MLALTTATNPGPFAQRTIELGAYYGVRAGGELVAIAGERIRLAGFTEISAVCVVPRYRGRGYAAALTLFAAKAILAQSQVPLLHVMETKGSLAICGYIVDISTPVISLVHRHLVRQTKRENTRETGWRTIR